jgi:diketogulonate reductase-like aldo/keto reductase
MRAFGSTGREVPAIGQGTWNLENAPRERALAALRRGLDLGLTHIDTAEMYGSGAVEELVGEAIAGRRDQVFLVSKVMAHNASRAGVMRACEQSLRRLATDRLDCFLLHWPSDHPLEETIAAFEQLQASGKISSYGVSNFDAALLERAVSLAGPGRIACNQVLYHLAERAPEGALAAACARHAVALVGYSPFAEGRFPSSRTAGGRALDEIARAHQATARQVTLAFLTRLPGSFAIPKAAMVAHVDENAGALALQLSADQVARLEAAFPA